MKAGRPKKKSPNKRITFCISLYREDKKKLYEMSKKMGVTPSILIRALIAALS